MAWLCGRAVLQTCRRTISYSAARCAKAETFNDPMEHATGLEKRELLAQTAGEPDPYNFMVMRRSKASTKNDPNLIPSAFDSRVIGCICEEDATYVNWMWLHQGAPRRCECGHWFKLVEKTPV